ncbi:MAG: PSD1 domain-containing protein [Acidobacteriaceae bacterium]|nr:PSD1 domain-containing protein [Acidobacteriaceae bacterium]
MSKKLLLCLLPAGAAFFSWAQTAEPPMQKVDFERDVRPIFEKSCANCHGPQVQLGALRLDSKTLAFAGGQSRQPGIVPGKPEQSTLFQRIAGTTDQARMPMGGKPLDAAAINTIKNWIAQGAEWPEAASAKAAEIKKHWAYIPPVRPSIPKNAGHPIDYLVRAKLAAESLSPSPEADRTTLLRRLALDLTGLPPTPAEVDAFLADKSKNAYEKQVERLLASPHHGERWGRHWLDAARYADSDGFEKDKQRFVWFYRDWVIKAINEDKPYSQFVIEQLAGDLLPNPTQDQLVATGFLRNSMVNEEGGVDPEQFRMEAMFDRVDTIGKSILGVTIGCAQCHNHKFDPLTQEEYYKIFAFLNDSAEGSVSVYTPEQQMQRADLLRRIKEIEDDLQHKNPDWRERLNASAKPQPAWTTLTPAVEDISTGGQKYLPKGDGSMLAAGYAPTRHRAKMVVKTSETGLQAIRVELLKDPNLPHGGPGRSIEGTGALTEIELEVAPQDAPDKIEKIKFVRASADFEMAPTPLKPIYWDKTDNSKRLLGPVSYAIDGDDKTAWGIDAGPGRRNQPRQAVFITEKPFGYPQGTILNIYLKQNHGGWNSDDNQNNNLGRMRLSVSTAADAVAQGPLHFSTWRQTVSEWKEQNEAIEALWKQHPEPTSQLVLGRAETMRDTKLLLRGDFLKPGKLVQPGVPAFLHALPAGAEPSRLTFAKWLVDRQSPTTARAFVNRVWQAYFGQGLVTTPEDLGKQSDAPSNPELLDYLAVEFMDSGWSMKKLHRLIVSSATYKQSSKATPELLSKDQFNKWLARGPRLRVEGEVVRDITLAAAGLLNPKIGGPAVYPAAPEFLFLPPNSYGPKIWKEEKGEDRYRRAVYTHRYRSVPYPMLSNFDTPNGDVACVRRSRSNTPLQALTALNEPMFLEAARALALKTLREGGKSDAQRVEFAFRRVAARKPAPEERTILLALLEKQTQRFTSGSLNPQDLLGGDPPAGVAPATAAGWTAVARVLLNLDETITKE